jgi:predicted dehydrogenase
MKATNHFNRREAIAAGAAAASIAIVPRHVLGGAGQTAPSEKLNIAGVGLNGMGIGDVRSCANEKDVVNVVALCDVDKNVLARCAKVFPDAKLHTDFRKMLEGQKNIDAVVTAPPDHLHAVISIMAMKMGKHVHCQKPLTHSVYEARQMGKVAKETKVATQMGNQGQAGDAARLLAELIWAGAIGTVREVHGGSNRTPMISPRGIARPKQTAPVPANLDWDLWLGPARERPYLDKYREGPFVNQTVYHPFSWRGWWDFGTGCLGDIGCHQFSAIFKALKPGHPTSIEASSSNHPYGKEVRDETAPLASITRWEFPAAGDRAAFTLTWWDGGLRPPRPEELEAGRDFGEGDWFYVIGERGKIYGHTLIPYAKAQEYGRPPRKLERSPGHYKEWILACKGGTPAGSNFVTHAAHLAEVVLLGNIALRTPGKLLWDGENMKFTNSKEANPLINPPYREGWSL